MVEPLYVITWRYGDGSGSGAVAAFTTEAAAEKMLGILNQQDSMRNYKIEPVPFDGAAGAKACDRLSSKPEADGFDIGRFVNNAFPAKEGDGGQP